MAIEVNKARNEWTDEFTRWFLDGVPSLESYPDYYGSGDLYEGENFKPKGS